MATLCALLVLAGCGAKQVQVKGNFPKPVVEPLPITVGVYYSDEFAAHEFFDEAKGRNESQWLVKTGEAQVAFWDKLFAGAFRKTIRIYDLDQLKKRRKELDAVIVPSIQDLQYTIPLHTNIKIYEIWMRYGFQFISIEDKEISRFALTAYGKTPTAFLQSDEQAVNLAAVVALRDAGANFITSFERIPEVNDWLQQRSNRPKTVPAPVAAAATLPAKPPEPMESTPPESEVQP
ncbi:hypothetical protein [Luminiphilus syltensis]|uniref:hypothetical protein n=1 Tax=Luminiphilus syltensis TaxID=1341119 RepID=UPI0002DFB205|nr:hypothetical protein [Luminiphilus syltensis]